MAFLENVEKALKWRTCSAWFLNDTCISNSFMGNLMFIPESLKRTSSHLDFVNVVPDGSFQTQSGFIAHPQKLEPIGSQDSWDLLCDGAKCWGFPATLFTIGFVPSFFPKKKHLYLITITFYFPETSFTDISSHEI